MQANKNSDAALYLYIYSHITEFLLSPSFLIRVSGVILVWCLLGYALEKVPMHYSSWKVFSWTEKYESSALLAIIYNFAQKRVVWLNCVSKKLGCWSDVHASWLLTNCFGRINPSFEALRSQTLKWYMTRPNSALKILFSYWTVQIGEKLTSHYAIYTPNISEWWVRML